MLQEGQLYTRVIQPAMYMDSTQFSQPVIRHNSASQHHENFIFDSSVPHFKQIKVRPSVCVRKTRLVGLISSTPVLSLRLGSKENICGG